MFGSTQKHRRMSIVTTGMHASRITRRMRKIIQLLNAIHFIFQPAEENEGGARLINRIADFHGEMTEWRRRIHAHPETAFEEHNTAALVSELLESFGVSVERGVARTGVIGTLKGSVPGNRAVALRADMDALHG
jgi:metal-dependent amidase/aminoacylase/carboxypeptidase family protein